MRIGVVQVRDAQPLIWSLPERATLSIAVHDCRHDFLTTSCDCDIEFSQHVRRPAKPARNRRSLSSFKQAPPGDRFRGPRARELRCRP